MNILNLPASLALLSRLTTLPLEKQRCCPVPASVMNKLAFALAPQGCKQAALSVLPCAVARPAESAQLTASRDEIGTFPQGAEPCQPFVCGAGAEAVR